MRQLYALALALGTLVASGCAGLPEARTPEEVVYLRDVDAEPLEFTITLLELDQAIDRTVDWMVRYERAPYTAADRAAFKEAIRSADAGFILSPPRYQLSHLGTHQYSVLFTVDGWNVSVAVSTKHDGMVPDETLERNARILVHFIRTGEEQAELIG